jgi:hypothetical protein
VCPEAGIAAAASYCNIRLHCAKSSTQRHNVPKIHTAEQSGVGCNSLISVCESSKLSVKVKVCNLIKWHYLRRIKDLRAVTTGLAVCCNDVICRLAGS